MNLVWSKVYHSIVKGLKKWFDMVWPLLKVNIKYNWLRKSTWEVQKLWNTKFQNVCIKKRDVHIMERIFLSKSIRRNGAYL